jgi:hypothetical protein
VIRILVILTFAVVGAFAQSTPMRFANIPACPSPNAKLDEKGNQLLLRAQDPAGHAIDIWCVKEPGGYNYQYRLPAGKRIDRCQLTSGINAAGVEHEGNVSEATLPNGGQWLRIAGKLLKFTHHNWDTTRGHHAVYNYARETLTVYNTVPTQDAAGRWVRAFVDVNALPLANTPQQEPLAALGKNVPERAFEPNHVGCMTALADEGFRIVEHDVDGFVAPDTPGKYTIAWPESTPIDKFLFDPRRRELRLKFLPNTRKAIVSIAIPRTMLGLGRELSHVRLDGNFVVSDETTTATYKAIRFVIDEPVKEALLTESQGFPFFAVTGIALLGAVIIGLMIGFLFRRKLPAVPED